MYVLYYVIISLFISTFLTMEYMRDYKERLEELKATKQQKRQMTFIAFIIYLFFWPITLIEQVIKLFKKNKKKGEFKK